MGLHGLGVLALGVVGVQLVADVAVILGARAEFDLETLRPWPILQQVARRSEHTNDKYLDGLIHLGTKASSK